MTQIRDVADLVNSVLDQYGKNMMTDIASDLQSYPACEKLLEKKRVTKRGGQGYKFNVLHTEDNNARNIGLYEVDDLDIVDGTVQGTIDWRFTESGTFFDVKEVSANAGEMEIFDLVKSREYQMWIGYYKLMEANFWDGPSSSADSKTPWGMLNYWLDYSATQGFNGGNHANFAGGPAGIDCGTYANWSHYTAQYAAVTDSDLIQKMRAAAELTGFRGIPNKPIKSYADVQNHYIYTTYATLSDMEELLDTKNDNVRFELAKYDGMTTFRRIPVMWVPYLEQNHATSDPVIGVNWSAVKTVALQGEWERTTPYHMSGTQHDIRKRFVNSSFNICIEDRRRNFLIAKSDPMSD